MRVRFCNLPGYFLLNSSRYNLGISKAIMNDKFVSAPLFREVLSTHKSVHVAQVKHILNFHTILGNYTQLTLDKLAWHNLLIISLSCCPKIPAYGSGSTILDIFDTQAPFKEEGWYKISFTTVYCTRFTYIDNCLTL